MKSALEVWVPRDPSSGRPGAPNPQEKSWDSELQKCHTFIQQSPPAPQG